MRIEDMDNTNATSNATAAPSNPQAAVDQTLTLLKAKDDTSRFVGLSLLRSLLDSNEQLRTDEENLLKCWNAISNKFLFRLLKAQENVSRSKHEARDMVDLAVAVVHIFANLLPAQLVGEKKMVEFCEPLLNTIPRIDSDSQRNAFQALQCIASTSSGGVALAAIKDWKPMIDAASRNEEILAELFRLQRATGKSGSLSDSQQAILAAVTESTIAAVNDYGKLDSIKILEALAELTSEISYHQSPRWVPFAIDLIRNTIKKQPTSRGRNACIKLAANLIQGLPPTSRFAFDLFKDPSSDDEDGKPFSYIFINLTLIEIRSTIPSLLESLASATYTSTALRLAACYDIMSAFIMYLLQHVDQDDDVTEDLSGSALSPEQFLRIRKDFAETLSLTLEFFRDRWDATISGAGGLHPSARNDPKTPLALTWDNPSVSPSGDPIILAGLRALSLWLREDENIELQQEATSLMDMFMALYSSSMATDAKVDFRHAILTCLSGLLPESDDAVQQFLDHNGWKLLQDDLLCSIVQLNIGIAQPVPAHTQDIIRALLLVVESDIVPQTRLPWMVIVEQLADLKPPSVQDEEKMETLIGGWQLAVALIVKAPRNVQKKHAGSMQRIKQTAAIMLEAVKGSFNSGLIDGLEEVIDGLDEIA